MCWKVSTRAAAPWAFQSTMLTFSRERGGSRGPAMDLVVMLLVEFPDAVEPDPVELGGRGVGAAGVLNTVGDDKTSGTDGGPGSSGSLAPLLEASVA
jgi:hypothetical protein